MGEEQVTPWAWLCNGKGDGWEERDKIVRDPELAAQYMAQPEKWKVQPLYLSPPAAVPEGWVMVPRGKMLSALRGRADNAYCDYIRQMQRDECLGAEHKLSTGTFGQDNLNAHGKAREYLGRHRAFVDAEKVFLEVLAAAPPPPPGKTEGVSSCSGVKAGLEKKGTEG